MSPPLSHTHTLSLTRTVSLTHSSLSLSLSLSLSHTGALLQAVPWFLANMPEDYFVNVPRELQMRHLQAITALSDYNSGS